MSRLLSIDIFRGITVAFMILVNNMGDQNSYTMLKHANWNGCTLADLVFPFFILIAGISTTLSLSNLRNKGYTNTTLIIKIFKRTLTLFLIGIFLNAFPNHLADLSHLRILGILQRIAICYLFVSILYLTTTIRTQSFIFIALLLTYWLLMAFGSPGYGANAFTLEENFAAYIDQLLIPSSHLYTPKFDPEGIFSTLPAIATALLGSFAGTWLLIQQKPQTKLWGLSLAGVLSAALGWLWGMTFPINKSLWSSSYVLWTGGLALLILAFCYWLVDFKQVKNWSKPLEVFGKNAMAAFVLHVLLIKIQRSVIIQTIDHTSIDLKSFLMRTFFGQFSAETASLLYGLASVLFCLIALALPYRQWIARISQRVRFYAS